MKVDEIWIGGTRGARGFIDLARRLGGEGARAPVLRLVNSASPRSSFGAPRAGAARFADQEVFEPRRVIDQAKAEIAHEADGGRSLENSRFIASMPMPLVAMSKRRARS